MKTKRLSKYLARIGFSLAIAVALSLHFTPVGFDAGVCGGGYRAWVVDKHSVELINILLEEHGLNRSTNVKLVSSREDIIDTVDWDGRNIYLSLKVGIEDNIYTVDFTGKKYWVEKYNWKIARIFA